MPRRAYNRCDPQVAGPGPASMINTVACNAARVTGCGQIPASFPVGLAQLLMVDPGSHTLYIVGSTTLSVISTAA
jgi:hypothetical protein